MRTAFRCLAVPLLFTLCVFLTYHRGQHLSKNINIIHKNSAGSVSAMVPFTSWGEVKPCGLYFNELEVMSRALKCANTAFKSNINPMLPRCFIIPPGSPDVHRDQENNFNFISTNIFLTEKIVGFYEYHAGGYNIYVVENGERTAEIYYHELGHYLAGLITKNADAPHTSPYFKQCAPGHFVP